MDTLIVGGTLVGEHAAFPAHLGIENGKVAGVYAPGATLPAADETIDASGLLVVPGAVDAHAHFTGLHDQVVDSLRVGTSGAAAGGVTTILEHPQSNPPATTVERFVRKREIVAANSLVDFGLWGGLDPEHFDQLEPLHRKGAVAFKGFMCSTAIDGAPRNAFGLPRLQDDAIVRAMEIIAGFDGLVALHAENHALLTGGIAALKAAGRRDPHAHAEASPPFGEVEAVSRALLLARETGVRCHIVHLSVAEAAAMLRQAKKHARVSAETCPHYLVLDEDDLVRAGPFGRCAPPLRTRANVEALWEYAFDGTLEFLASDHCPYLMEQKTPGFESIWDAALGLNGIQTMCQLLLSEGVNARGLPLGDFVRLTSAGPAKRFGLYPTKGALQMGSDADVVLYDPTEVWTIRSQDLFLLAAWSPYEGRECRGRVKRTLVRGRTVYADGEIRAEPGSGQLVRQAGAG